MLVYNVQRVMAISQTLVFPLLAADTCQGHKHPERVIHLSGGGGGSIFRATISLILAVGDAFKPQCSTSQLQIWLLFFLYSLFITLHSFIPFSSFFSFCSAALANADHASRECCISHLQNYKPCDTRCVIQFVWIAFFHCVDLIFYINLARHPWIWAPEADT